MSNDWLDQVTAEIAEDPQRIERHFPAVGRKVGRAPLHPDIDPQALRGSVDDVARAGLVTTVVDTADPATAAQILTNLYRHGDDAERRGVMRGLAAINAPESLVATGIELVNDALRTNDPRLVAAAMGEFAGRHLPSVEWRGGVLKCLFMEIPLVALAAVEDRRDADLKVQAENLATERRAAGRTLSPDLTALIDDRPIPA
ncbi:EboA domain-containing protein [Granulicoccus sp. GXG6511]|uniref:EboA domain-containing protein n=1 Tax=Granulicoccus sp. GXG6511 TaxID=3381351 RepID=UPI003D7DCF14